MTNNLSSFITFLKEKNGAAPALIAGVCFILGMWIAGYEFYAVHTLDNTLSVTGSAYQSATANSAKWTVSVGRTAYEGTISQVQQQVVRDSQVVTQYFKKAGLKESDISVGPIYSDQEYSSDTNAPRRYNERQEITVSSDEPELILRLSKEIASLSSQGILLSPHMPEYYISNLPELRIALIGKAVQDAKLRAEKIAESTGRGVGKLQSANGGVVQVLAENSIDVSDYGSYDTSTIEKKVMVTARATFYLK